MPLTSYGEQTPDGLIHRYSYDRHGKIQGIYTIHTADAILVAVRFFLNSTPHGVHQEYYHNGQLRSECHFDRGEETGIATYYHPDGVIASTVLMCQGKREGICRGFWPNGNHSYRAAYTNGVRHGSSYEYYESGQVALQEEYTCGQMTHHTMYSECGNIIGQRGSPPRGRICARCGPRPCDCLVADPKPFRGKGSPGSTSSSGSAPASPTSYFDCV